MNVIASDGSAQAANLTTSAVAAFLADTDGAAGSAISATAAADIFYIAVDNGTDTGIYLVDDADDSDTVIDAADLTLLVTIEGLAAAEDLTADSFADFA